MTRFAKEMVKRGIPVTEEMAKRQGQYDVEVVHVHAEEGYVREIIWGGESIIYFMEKSGHVLVDCEPEIWNLVRPV